MKEIYRSGSRKFKGPRDSVLQDLCQTNQLLCNRYRLIRVLGQGGFGVTYLSQDITLPHQPFCVIKQLCPQVDTRVNLKLAQQRFEQEARILAMLGGHAQIPALLDYFEHEGNFFLVQEFVRGLNLSQQVRKHGPWSEEMIRNFLLEILPLLSYLHQRDVIHRDIKPSNIIRCTLDDRIVLLDFGAVKLGFLDRVEPTGLHKSVIGTDGFAAPEQLALRPTYATDLYALGMTCLYLLTGKSPKDFPYNRLSETIQWKAFAKVSLQTEIVIDRLIRPSLQERYLSAQQVLLDLDQNLKQDFAENYLFHCLHSRPQVKSVRSRPTKITGEDKIKNYQPPVTRLASSLRSLRSRLPHQKILPPEV